MKKNFPRGGHRQRKFFPRGTQMIRTDEEKPFPKEYIEDSDNDNEEEEPVFKIGIYKRKNICCKI